ncbi:MAG TPA: hypothetical protein QF716_02070 [Candidatus Thalassarchaeaceae archaeon]|jgi:uncharacterized tellurite resistance protein B-like protein|nr:hypothetical protein [Candidatus Thalassarchaeaceae archaeon]HJM67647.1 hypothetical protein [Candidatus Thalassarchaeaceae archaeon]
MLLTLTVEQRVLLHLWDTPLGDNPWEGRPELTQAGVSDAVGIARKHLPRTLKKLREKARIHEETRHVAGAKQRCRVYALSPEGRKAASELVDDIHTRIVKADGEQTTVQALHNHATGLLDVLRNIDSSGTYRPPIDGEVADIAPLDGRDLPLDHRLAVYDNIVRTAWSDGVVTKDEQAMLDDMAMYLGLEPYDTEPIEKRVREESIDPDAENSSLYKQMLEVAWQDGEVDANEQAMLDSLAGMLGLDSARNVQLDWVCDRLDDRMKAYCSAMEAAWEDGRVSGDEENILQNLRDSLSISEQEHKTILGVVRAKLN